MDDLGFYVRFNSISVISGQWMDDNGKLCVIEPCLWLRRLYLGWGSNPGLLDQWASAEPTELPGLLSVQPI